MTPEAAAAALLERAGFGGVPPIDVTFIAEEVEALDIQQHVDLRTLPDAPASPSGTRLSGLLLPDQRRIWVDASEAMRSAGRRRFTIAHELGHWCLHAQDGEARARFCRPDDVGAGASQLELGAGLEHEANRFAAALLMPEPLVRKAAVRARLSIPLLARSFGVSAAAMQVRLQSLHLLPDYMRR
jgi:hypothetical protein